MKVYTKILQYIYDFLYSDNFQFSLFICLAYIMQQSQKTTKKWVDYSDQSEEQPDSDHQIPLRTAYSEPPRLTSQNSVSSTKPSLDHCSPEFIEQEIGKFEKLGDRDVWVLVQSSNQGLLDKKIKNFKDDENSGVIYTFVNKEIKGAWDLKVKNQVVQKWLKNGMDQDRNIKISVSEKNFKPRNQNYDNKTRNGDRRGGYKNNNNDRGQNGGRGQRRDRGDRQRGDRGGRRGGRGGRRRQGQQNGHQLTEQQRQQRRNNRQRNDEPRQKKVYVDKATGKAPSNKEETQKKVIEQKQRHYTKQQAEKVGLQLGNFRNKPKVVETKSQVVQSKPVEQPVKRQRQRQRQRQKEEPKAWSRKQRVVQDKNDFKKVEYREKNSTRQQQHTWQQKPKKKYVTKKPEGEQVRQQKGKKKDTNGLLSEDSN